MSTILDKLLAKDLISPPSYVVSGIQYLVVMGSEAYGVSVDKSDRDVYGFCIPPKELIFPQIRGEILGFGRQMKRFNDWSQHHIKDKETKSEYDFSVYNIVQYFNLVMENNPNMVDSLFVPTRCVLHCNHLANLVRDERKAFLHKGCWHKFKGYSYSQMHKMDTKEIRVLVQLCENHGISEEKLTHHVVFDNPHLLGINNTEELDYFTKIYKACTKDHPAVGKRFALVKQFGFDVKFAYNVVRLLNEVEMILSEGDLDLERNREQLKAIRRGEWTLEQVKEYFSSKERELESLYQKSTLPWGPDEDRIKSLLINCLEEHFGSLGNVITKPDDFKNLMNDLQFLVEKYRG